MDRRELERKAVIGLAAAAAVPLLLWFVAWEVPPPEAFRAQASSLGNLWRERDELAELYGTLVRARLGSLAIAGLLACGIAIALSLRGYAVPTARLLAQACALGAAALAYFCFVRIFLPLPGLHPFARFLLDCAAVVMSAGGVTRFYQFLRRYPVQVALEDSAAASAGPGGWMRFKRVNAGLLRAMDSGLFGLLLIVAALDVFIWLVGKEAGLGLLSVLLALAVLIEGLAASTYNARHMATRGEQRHEWVYVGMWMALLFYLLLPVVAGVAWAIAIFSGVDVTARAVTPLGKLVEVGSVVFAGGLEGAFVIVLLLLIILSIFYHGDIDPRLVIRRGTVIGLLATALGLAFVAAERFLTLHAARYLGLSEDVAWIAAALIAGVVVMPLRRILDRRIRGLVDRLSPPTDLAEGERVQATIVFSDLSGFTALSARDERSALIAASVLHKAGREVASANRGRLVKTIGDAVVLEFAQADDAVRATADLHRAYGERSRKLELPDLQVHSGIHAGEVLKANDGDIYGSTVNLAARLQDAAKPGEIVASDAVRSDGKSGVFSWVPLGERMFKNVPDPVNCMRLEFGGSAMTV